ncbi:MAG: hypothetical protein O3A08_13300 [Proteobacteria bacterium]|nr:hypothetical protein [Pseudomonadota bacterium]
METDAQPVKLTDQFAFGLAMIMLSAVFFGLVPFFARSLTEAASPRQRLRSFAI